jgi:hypothetical protein
LPFDTKNHRNKITDMNEPKLKPKQSFEVGKERVEINQGWSLTKRLTGIALVLAYLCGAWYMIITFLMSLFE